MKRKENTEHRLDISLCMSLNSTTVKKPTYTP